MSVRCLRLRVLVVLTGLVAGTAGAASTLTVTPPSTSNTFAGTLALVISGGLSNGQGVMVEKHLDLNTNGVIDPDDPLVESFALADGQLQSIAGATNYNRPRDHDAATNAAISTALSFLDTSRTDHIAGRYLFVVRDTIGALLATNSFTLTNFPFSQAVTGLVQSAGTNVPGALVALLRQTFTGETRFAAGAVANQSGAYAVRAAAGAYQLVAVRAGHVAPLNAAPSVILGAGQTLGTNLNLVPATRTVSGRLVDAADTNLGLAGVELFFESTNGLFTLAWTDAAGNFSVPVTAGGWAIEPGRDALARIGYAAPAAQDLPFVSTAGGNVSGVIIAAPRVVSLFYGTLTDASANPIPGVEVFGEGDDGATSVGLTDTNGVFAVGATVTNWFLGLSDDDLAAKGFVGGSGTNFNFTNDLAVRVDFSVLAAPHTITGSVRDTNNAPVAGVAVFATATISDEDYFAIGRADATGGYTLRVAAGTWSVGLDCNRLTALGFECATNVPVNLPPGAPVVNFVLQTIQTLRVTTTALATGRVGSFYFNALDADGGAPPYSWFVSAGALPGGLALDLSGVIQGTPTNAGRFHFTAHAFDSMGASASSNLSIPILGPATLTNAGATVSNQFEFLLRGGAGLNYIIQFNADLGTTNWVDLLATNSPGNIFRVVISNATNPAGFYRAVAMP